MNDVRELNFCNVTSTPQEFALLFGTGVQPPDGGVIVNLRERVWLQPVAAKLLRDLLSKTVAEFEAQHGEIANGYKPLPGSEPLAVAAVTQAQLPSGLPEAGALMVELVEGLRARHELERSVKMVEGAALTQRFLMGASLERLGNTASIRLPVIWKRLGMPEAQLAAAREGLPKADFVHFGYEGGAGAEIMKVYLEDTKAALEPAKGNEGQLLYTGYKWKAGDAAQASVSRYTAFPQLPAAKLTSRLKPLIADLSAPLKKTCQALLQLALDRVPAEKLLLVEVRDEETPRVSFDLNLYHAKLQLAEVLPLLADAARNLQIPLAELQPAYEEGKHCLLGHISAGLNRDGKPFFTFYYGGHSTRA